MVHPLPFLFYPSPMLHSFPGILHSSFISLLEKGDVNYSSIHTGIAALPVIPLLSLLPPISQETLFALSLFPYLGFLWFLTRSRETPRLALIGFYMTLVFVAITIPAGIYAKVAYGQVLADVDFLHGGAEAFLTLANILVVLGFGQAILERQSSSKQN